jgi:hypothetical protein
MNGMDIYLKNFLLGLTAIFFVLVVWWFYKISTLVNVFLKASLNVIGGVPLVKGRILPIFLPEEIKGSYKGRDVVVGVHYSGLKGEFLPLPNIRMRLREVIGYNLNRLPNYAVIEKNCLVFKVKISVLWGIFDKNFPQVFTKSYLVVALEKLVATAEDVERGRTLKEVFK